MKPAHILEKSDHEGRVYFKAVGFLQGKTYRGMPSRSVPRSDVLRIMTRNPNARHPGDWPSPAEQRAAKEALRQRVYDDAMNH